MNGRRSREIPRVEPPTHKGRHGRAHGRPHVGDSAGDYTEDTQVTPNVNVLTTDGNMNIYCKVRPLMYCIIKKPNQIV